MTVPVGRPLGPLFCIVDGSTRGRSGSSAGVRVEFRRLAAQAGGRGRFALHQLRHAHAVELAREGVPLNVIQRQLFECAAGPVRECEVLPAGTGSRTSGACHRGGRFHGMQTSGIP